MHVTTINEREVLFEWEQGGIWEGLKEEGKWGNDVILL